MNHHAIKPNINKALFFARKQLAEFIYDAVNLEGINYTMPEVQTLLYPKRLSFRVSNVLFFARLNL
jgi:hypothetical protein